MKTIFLKLKFVGPDADASSTQGNAWIVPGDHTRDNDGWPLLTPHCADLGELEWHINRMQADLEEIRKEARRKFAAARLVPPAPLNL